MKFWKNITKSSLGSMILGNAAYSITRSIKSGLVVFLICFIAFMLSSVFIDVMSNLLKQRRINKAEELIKPPIRSV